MRRYFYKKSPLFNVRGKGQLEAALRNRFDYIEGISQAAHGLYKIDQRKMPNGKLRLIENPDQGLKTVQSRVGELLMRIAPPEYLAYPVRKIGPVDNAARHLGSRQVWTIDLRDYYHNTAEHKVLNYFKNYMNMAADLATILTRILTLKGRIPTGAPSSPILAFYANMEMWREIDEIGKNYNVTQSVYQDDLAASGLSVPFTYKRAILKVIKKYGFIAHKEKFYSNAPALITGVIVKSSGLDAPNEHYKKTRLKQGELERSKEVQTGDEVSTEAMRASLAGLRQRRQHIRRLSSRARR